MLGSFPSEPWSVSTAKSTRVGRSRRCYPITIELHSRHGVRDCLNGSPVNAAGLNPVNRGAAIDGFSHGRAKTNASLRLFAKLAALLKASPEGSRRDAPLPPALLRQIQVGHARQKLLELALRHCGE